MMNWFHTTFLNDESHKHFMSVHLLRRLLQVFAGLLIVLWLVRFCFEALAGNALKLEFLLLFGLSVVAYVFVHVRRYRWATRLLIGVLIISPYASLIRDDYLDVPALLVVTSIFGVMSAYFFLSLSGLLLVISANTLLIAMTLMLESLESQSANMAIIIVMVSSILILIAAVLRDLRETHLRDQTNNLLSSEARLRALFEAAFETIIVHDDAYLIDINRAGEELFGYKRSELEGLHLSDFLTRTLSIPSIDAVNKDELVPFESVGLTKNGEVFPVEVLTRAYEYRGQQVNVSAVRDITYRKKMESRLHRRIATEQMIASMSQLFAEISPEELANAFNASLELMGMLADVDRTFVFLLDTDNDLIKQVYEWCAEGIPVGYRELSLTSLDGWGWWTNHLRYSARVSITNINEFPTEVGNEQKTFKAAGVKSIIAVPMRYRHELIGFIGMDSTRIERLWSNDDTSLLQLAADMFVNALERSETALALQQSERQFSLVFNTSPVPICILSRQEGNFIDMNDAFMELAGYTRAQLEGRTASELELWFNDEVRETFLDEIRGKSRVQNIESAIKRQDGTLRDILVSAESIEIEGQDTLLILALDITERKQAELQSRLLGFERERVGLLNRFISDTSHDFKTPLSVIRMEIYLARRKSEIVEGDKPWFPHLEVIDLQITRLQNLISDLLRMSRLDRGDKFHFQPTDINQLMNMVINRRTSMIEENGQTLHFDPDTRLEDITLDAQEFSDAIDRIIINASRYSEQGDTITVRSLEDGEYVVIEVEDEGVGIPDEDLPNIFNRLYRGNQARTADGSGNGLGLPIAQQIIRAHSGEIEVDTTPGEGSTFRIRIPITQSSGTQEFEAFGTISQK